MDDAPMTAIVIVVLLACVAAGAGVLVMTRRIRESAQRSNEIIPGRPTNAPAAWAGSHDPEARLHRRIRDALALLRDDPGLSHDGERIDATVRLELAATDLDNWLVSVSKTPPRLRETALAHADTAVTELENVAAGLSAGGALPADRVDALISRISSPPALGT
jgi:hypothetical protein